MSLGIRGTPVLVQVVVGHGSILHDRSDLLAVGRAPALLQVVRCRHMDGRMDDGAVVKPTPGG